MKKRFLTAALAISAALATLPAGQAEAISFAPDDVTIVAAAESAGAEAAGAKVVGAEAAGASDAQKKGPREIHMMALGDNLLHMGIVRTGQLPSGRFDYNILFRGMKVFLDKADIKMINQETILGGNERGFSGFPLFNSPVEVSDSIATAGFNVVTHATNHTADQGVKGLIYCADYWREHHPEILVTGIYGSEEQPEHIPVLDIDGVRFAVLNYAYGPNAESFPSALEGHMNLLCAYDAKTRRIDFTTLNPKVLEEIAEAKTKADVVIVCPHWGTEYQKEASSYQKTFAKEMTQAGADVIVGTHPHVVQPVEYVTADNGNMSLCYYSLGNYVSTQNSGRSMLEAMAWTTFYVDENGAVSLVKKESGAIPMVCQYTSGPTRFKQVFLLENYDEDLAKSHGIRKNWGINLTCADLQKWSAETLGDFAMTGKSVLGTE